MALIGSVYWLRYVFCNAAVNLCEKINFPISISGKFKHCMTKPRPHFSKIFSRNLAPFRKLETSGLRVVLLFLFNSSSRVVCRNPESGQLIHITISWFSSKKAPRTVSQRNSGPSGTTLLLKLLFFHGVSLATSSACLRASVLHLRFSFTQESSEPLPSCHCSPPLFILPDYLLSPAILASPSCYPSLSILRSGSCLSCYPAPCWSPSPLSL